MIIRLTKEQQTEERRKLLSEKPDVVYIICHEALKELRKNDHTELSAVEVFLTARSFVSALLQMTEPEEAIEDELEDLEEALNETDAMIISMVIATLLQAVSTTHIGFNAHSIILKIFTKWNDHPLFFWMLDRFCEKEQTRWVNGSRTKLFSYELEHIDMEEGGSNALRDFLAWILSNSNILDADSIKGIIFALGKYNIDHASIYSTELKELYKKLGVLVKTTVEGDLVIKKEVQYEVNGVEDGGTGILVNGKQE